MRDLRQQTVNTYNKSAQQLADYFRGIRTRVSYIDAALAAAGNPPHARVVEIGCGDGRDAKAIVKKADWYLGFDIAEELIKLAKTHVPTAHFEVADAATFKYPKDLDVVFAFASLLHLNKQEVQHVFGVVHASLRPGGVFYISLKNRSEYASEIKKDEFGTRLFYFYNADIITKLAGEGYEVVKVWLETRGKTAWLEMILRKR